MAEKYAGKAMKKLAKATQNLTVADFDKLAGVDATAAEIDSLDGVTAIVGEHNLADNQPASMSFSYAAGAANVAEVTITVLDSAGVAIAKPFNLDVWLSDAATGAGLTSTSASGTVQAKATDTDLAILVAKKCLRIQTKATGIYILEITDDAKTAFYPAAEGAGMGPQVGAAMAGGDYGA